MFEDKSPKLYEALLDKLNNLYLRNPIPFVLAISFSVSAVVLFVSLTYRTDTKSVEITKNTVPDNLVTLENGSKEIKADLAGAVRSPGVYTLKVGSRLSELISLGGGFVSDVSAIWVSKNLNMSKIITDSQKVYIPFEWDIAALEEVKGVKALSLGAANQNIQSQITTDRIKDVYVNAGDVSVVESTSSLVKESSASSKVTATEAGRVNINSATSSELDSLPGVGPAYAGRIIENRPYTSFEEFEEKSNLPSSLIESLKESISF